MFRHLIFDFFYKYASWNLFSNRTTCRLIFTGEISGKFTNHKGRNRRFTNPEELEEQRLKEEEERRWRRDRGDSSTEEEEDGVGGPSAVKEHGSDSDSETESSSEEVNKISFLNFSQI